MEIQPIDPNKPLTVTQTAQDWNTAMTLMNAGFQRLAESMLGQLNQPFQTAPSPPQPAPDMEPSPQELAAQRKAHAARTAAVLAAQDDGGEYVKVSEAAA